jgi:hypothetical protein
MGKSGSEPVPGGTSLTLLSQCRDEAQLGMSPQKSKAQKQSTKAKRNPQLRHDLKSGLKTGLKSNSQGVAKFPTVQQAERCDLMPALA